MVDIYTVYASISLTADALYLQVDECYYDHETIDMKDILLTFHSSMPKNLRFTDRYTCSIVVSCLWCFRHCLMSYKTFADVANCGTLV